MADIKDLFKPFIATDAKVNWTSYTSPRMEYFRNDVPGVSFNAGFLVASKIGYMDIPHIHDGADSFFIFTGADLDNIFESEFELDFFMGDDPNAMELYTITKPTFIRVPAGVWHSPVYYKKVVRGTNTLLWYGGVTTGRVYPRTDKDGKTEVIYEPDTWDRDCVKDPSKKCTWCGLCFNQTDESVTEFMEPFYKNLAAERKYEHCVMELKGQPHKLGDAVQNPRIAFKGAADMPGADRQFSFNIITKPCKLGDDEPVSNGQAAEFLWFSGADAFDPWTSFDAEIEVMLGNDPEHMESVKFDKPGVVVVPPGVWRGAVSVKRAGKPVCFMPWYPYGGERYKLTQRVAGGEKLLVFTDETMIKEPTAGDELFMQIKR